MMEKFKCVECGMEDVENENDMCDTCYYELEESDDFEEDEE
jgi:NMD protein affecting ribosome stability and mRNA decay